MDFLTKLQANINLACLYLKTPKSSLKIFTQDNPVAEVYVIPALSKTLVTLPVQLKQGHFYTQQTFYNKHLEISGGLYNSSNGLSRIEVINSSSEDQILCLEQPLEIIPYDTDKFLEINNISSDNQISQNTSKPINIPRTDHLNSEEKSKIIQLCNNYTDLFYDDDQKLTFTSNIKHHIRTTDNTPVYVKQYRYPYSLKQEVKEQKESMLKQNTYNQI